MISEAGSKHLLERCIERKGCREPPSRSLSAFLYFLRGRGGTSHRSERSASRRYLAGGDDCSACPRASRTTRVHRVGTRTFEHAQLGRCLDGNLNDGQRSAPAVRTRAVSDSGGNLGDALRLRRRSVAMVAGVFLFQCIVPLVSVCLCCR